MSVYDDIGGQPAVDAAVEIFYRKVLSDDSISDFFEGVDMEVQAAKQNSFITMALGGPNNYTGLDMRTAHKKMVDDGGLNDAHFDSVVGHLADTLIELGVPADTVAGIGAKLEGLRADVLNK